MYNFRDMLSTKVRMYPYSVKTLDKSIESINISIGEVKQLFTIDEMPEPNFLRFNTKDFIPQSVLDKAKDIVKDVKYWFIPDHETIREIFAKAEEVDGVEFADWMYDAAAANVIGEFITNNYNESNESVMTSRSGDAYIPGVSVEDLRFQSVTGYSIFDRLRVNILRTNFGVIDTLRFERFGDIVKGIKSIIKKDLLASAAGSAVKAIQWTGKLFKWKILAEAKPGKSVKNLVCVSAFGLTGPQFFSQSSGNRPARLIRVITRFWSKVDQRVHFRWRNPRNYEEVVHDDFVDVPAGESQLETNFGSYPNVPPLVCEVQPEKGNFAIRYYSVSVDVR